MQTIALLSHPSAAAVVAYRRGQALTAQHLLDDARRLARTLPPGRHVVNVCADRYRFAVGFAASLMTRRVSLLPSTHTPETIQQMAVFAPDAFCLTDDARCDIALPLVHFTEDRAPDESSAAVGSFDVPAIPVEQLAAIVFTSGSTGTPLPHEKRWGALAGCVLSGASLLGLTDGMPHTLVGTVPPQHMYGFESTLLLALLSGNAFCAERPFYPADVTAALSAVPRPRTLVTTPLHLRTLLASDVDFPAVDLVVSATAPLTQPLALEVEERYRSRLLEIYGSTETGQIALRRPAHGRTWQLWPGVGLSSVNGETFAHGGHVGQPTLLCDVIEIVGGQEFLLRGRTADMVNIAGKRSSFAYLNAQLNAIPGVLDGEFFLRDSRSARTGVARLAAMVEAPAMSVAALSERLRLRIDAVFMPRPLLIVPRLPRNETGKLPRAALDEALRRALRRSAGAPAARRVGPLSSALEIGADHPAYAGHFPSHPVLPGAVLLDAVIALLQRARDIDITAWRISSAKFLAAVKPGDELSVEHEATDAIIKFTIRSRERTVAAGTFAPSARGAGA